MKFRLIDVSLFNENPSTKLKQIYRILLNSILETFMINYTNKDDSVFKLAFNKYILYMDKFNYLEDAEDIMNIITDNFILTTEKI